MDADIIIVLDFNRIVIYFIERLQSLGSMGWKIAQIQANKVVQFLQEWSFVVQADVFILDTMI